MLRHLLRLLTAVVISMHLLIPAFAEGRTGSNWVEQAKDALAVVTAASLMAKAPATEIKAKKTKTGSVKGEDTGRATPLALPDLADMLATARALAGNQNQKRGRFNENGICSFRGDAKAICGVPCCWASHRSERCPIAPGPPVCAR